MQILKTAELRRFDFSEPVFKLLGNGRELQVEKFTGDQESYTLRPARRAALSKSDIPRITTADQPANAILIQSSREIALTEFQGAG